MISSPELLGSFKLWLQFSAAVTFSSAEVVAYTTSPYSQPRSKQKVTLNFRTLYLCAKCGGVCAPPQ